MSDNSTTARPYAKAAFEYALSNKAFDDWSNALTNLAAVAVDEQVQSLFNNPKLSREQRGELFTAVLGKDADKSLHNFVNLLSSNDRLAVLPEISQQFEILKAEVESALDGVLYTAQAIDGKQEKAIEDALSKRLNKTVKLETQIDESLIGGVKVKVGDFVIDGSIRARLEKMAGALTN